MELWQNASLVAAGLRRDCCRHMTCPNYDAYHPPNHFCSSLNASIYLLHCSSNGICLPADLDTPVLACPSRDVALLVGCCYQLPSISFGAIAHPIHETAPCAMILQKFVSILYFEPWRCANSSSKKTTDLCRKSDMYKGGAVLRRGVRGGEGRSPATNAARTPEAEGKQREGGELAFN